MSPKSPPPVAKRRGKKSTKVRNGTVQATGSITTATTTHDRTRTVVSRTGGPSQDSVASDDEDDLEHPENWVSPDGSEMDYNQMYSSPQHPSPSNSPSNSLPPQESLRQRSLPPSSPKESSLPRTTQEEESPNDMVYNTMYGVSLPTQILNKLPAASPSQRSLQASSGESLLPPAGSEESSLAQASSRRSSLRQANQKRNPDEMERNSSCQLSPKLTPQEHSVAKGDMQMHTPSPETSSGSNRNDGYELCDMQRGRARSNAFVVTKSKMAGKKYDKEKPIEKSLRARISSVRKHMISQSDKTTIAEGRDRSELAESSHYVYPSDDWGPTARFTRAVSPTTVPPLPPSSSPPPTARFTRAVSPTTVPPLPPSSSPPPPGLSDLSQSAHLPTSRSSEDRRDPDYGPAYVNVPRRSPVVSKQPSKNGYVTMKKP